MNETNKTTTGAGGGAGRRRSRNNNRRPNIRVSRNTGERSSTRSGGAASPRPGARGNAANTPRTAGAPSRKTTGRNNRPGAAKFASKKAAKKTGRKRRNTARKPRGFSNPPLKHRIEARDTRLPEIPELMGADDVRVIPISGVEEIGRNMTVVETKDDIIIFDAGFQFVSEADNAPGINYILPNTQYLEERKHKIRGLVVTHGHLDHTGGIPFIMERIGNPPIYTQYLTSLMILKRHSEFPHLEPIDMHIVKEGERFKLGNTWIKSFPVTHSIPDAMGLSVETPKGNVVITGDIKINNIDGEVDPEEKKYWEEIGKDNNLMLVMDSTNSEREGWSAPEGPVHTNMEEIIKNARGRLIIGTFASQFERLIMIIGACEKYGKKVVTEGRSIKNNVEIAITAELLKVKPDTIIDAKHMDDYPSDKIVILSTGAQGEQFAAMMRMATDKHNTIKLTDRDTIVLSSSVIPGNETAVQMLRDNIFRRNVRVVNYRTANVHSTGHGSMNDLIWVQQTLEPKYVMTVHGHHSMLKSHSYGLIESGFKKENIVVPDNGTIADIIDGELKVQKAKAINDMDVMVDGFTVGTRQEVVLRDRQSLAEDGMFVIIATVNTRTGKLRKSPDIISRGFVYLRENQQLLSEARILIKKTIERKTENMHPIDLDFVKDEVTDTVTGFLLQKTNKTPMVIPVLIGV